jgi:hypothetical protein
MRLIGLALLLAALGGAVVACSSFSASPAEDGGAPDGRADPDATDAQDVQEASSSADASLSDASADGGDCLDLTQAGAFQPFAAGGGVAMMTDAGHQISWPAGDAGSVSVAMWKSAVSVPSGANAATVTFDAELESPNVLPMNPPWYAAFAGVVQGGLTAVNTAPMVQLVLSNDTSASSFGLDVNTFPSGADMVGGPATSDYFDSVPGGARAVRAVLDVRWSADGNLQNVVVNLEGHPASSFSVKTIPAALVPSPSWTLVLGGAASKNPGLRITFTRVCVTPRVQP